MTKIIEETSSVNFDMNKVSNVFENNGELLKRIKIQLQPPLKKP